MAKLKKEATPPAPLERRFLRIEEAAAYLGMKPRTLRERVQRREIAFSRPGGKLLLFDINVLIAWVAANQTKQRDP